VNRNLGKGHLFWRRRYGKQAGISGGELFVLAVGYGKWGKKEALAPLLGTFLSVQNMVQ